MINNYIFSWIIFFGYWLIIANITFKIFIKKKPRYSSTTWLLIIYFLPLIGIVIWFLFSEHSLEKKRMLLLKKIWKQNHRKINKLSSHNYLVTNKNSEVAKPLFNLCKNRQGISGIKIKKLKLLTSSKKIIRNLIKDISLAKRNIEMVFYIWKPGGLADDVANALISSAKKGIYCRLILDSAGSTDFFRSKWVGIMKKEGIHIVEALKINILKTFFSRIDLRQHRKVILIDDYITYTGSMNLVDPNLFKQYCKVGKWIDLMTRIEGPIATTLGMIYSCDWELETGKKILPKIFYNKKKN